MAILHLSMTNYIYENSMSLSGNIFNVHLRLGDKTWGHYGCKITGMFSFFFFFYFLKSSSEYPLVFLTKFHSEEHIYILFEKIDIMYSVR